MADLQINSHNVHVNNNNMVAEQLKEKMDGTADFYGLELDPAELEDSLFEDATEEMSFAKDNSKQTKLETRKQRNAETKLEERLKKLRESIQGRVQAKSQSDDLRNEASRKDCTSEDLLARLKRYGGHSAEGYALLVELAENEEDPKKAELFKQAATKLYQENKGSIDAVINALNIDGPAEFGSFSQLENAENYADALLNFKDGYDMLNFIISKYKDDAKEGFDFMTNALSADLQAAHRSHAPEFLQSVASGLSMAKNLYSGYMHENKLLARLEQVHGCDVSSVDKLAFLKNLGDITRAAFISPNEIRNLLYNVNAKDPEQEVIVCQELSRTLHDMADVMFGSVDVRSKINDACARLIDSAIEAEDEWLSKQ